MIVLDSDPCRTARLHSGKDGDSPYSMVFSLHVNFPLFMSALVMGAHRTMNERCMPIAGKILWLHLGCMNDWSSGITSTVGHYCGASVSWRDKTLRSASYSGALTKELLSLSRPLLCKATQE